LHHALQNDTLVPYFQGIRNNKTGVIKKFEVLARIEKDGEVISPYRFLEPARLSGLLPEITKIIIDKSFKIMADKEYDFSLNLTEDDLARHYIIDYLDLKAQEYGVDPHRVIIEILEGISANGKKNHVLQLQALKERGYSIAIDDFGTEYSNFERVLDLDIDFLKIDAKYIKDIDTNPKSLEVTKAIVYFAKNAKIPCIAEFVHSKEVQDIMISLEIEFSQGYFFSEPSRMPLAF
jgi:EAL domain-containing protein (putative c-di-GMP-specific phosphodiesterase class I)